tara:strand:- start:5194 stop:6771 length:1578 start_codon:yes stop_codon:yes gene_type:complete
MLINNLKKNIIFIYSLILFFFSIFFNQYYGYIGIFPEDSFLIFNSGYDTLNGYFPFKDYWTTTGPLLDLIQALFFKIFGINWSSYVLHASVFNFIITISTFFVLLKFNLKINYCFFYSLLVAVLSYPNAGTPFMDHHSNILSTLSLFLFILAIKNKSNYYWFFLPILLGLSFLSKQVPASYVGLIIAFLSIFYFIFNFDIKKIFSGIFGSLFFIITFIIVIKLADISLRSFYEQYILFPKSMGHDRLNLLLPLEFNRIILKFKLIHLSLFFIIFVIIKNIITNYNYLKSNEFLILTSLVAYAFSLIITQLMTINSKYIFFIIPILVGFSHIYSEKYFNKKKYILFFLISLSFASTAWYHFNYNATRKFMDLEKYNINNAVEAKILNENFNQLKWITVINPNNPNEEMMNLKKNIEIIKNDLRKKTIVTDYQFISVFFDSYDFSPNRVWHGGANYPQIGHEYFEIYKKFFIDKLIENKIQVIYTIKPLWGDDNVLKTILSENCYTTEKISDTLDRQVILPCDDLKI